MSMHKIFRALLLVAMFITTYLLIIAWRNDYANPTLAPTTQVATSAVVGDVAPASDIPLASDMPAPTVAISNARLIDVQTPKYRLQIDLDGGDITQIALVNHKENLQTDAPFVLLQNDNVRTYVAQSGVIGKDGVDNAQGRAQYVSAKTKYTWQDAENGVLSVPLVYTKDGVRIEKVYQFSDSYPITLATTIANTSAKPWQGQLFYQLKRDESADPSLSNKGIMGLATYLGGAWGVPSAPYQKLKFAEFGKEKIAPSAEGWVGVVQHYFVAAWTPNHGQNPQGYVVKPFSRSEGKNHFIGYNSPVVNVGAGKQITLASVLYAGPKIQSEMKDVAIGLNQSVDYGFLWPISKFLFALLDGIYKIVGNWGWAIILLTLVVKTALMWFSGKSYASMAKMRAIAPKLTELKDKYGDDRMKMSQEMMRIYKEEKVNPLAGCLPVLLQMPIFLALYWVLVESVELRHAPWILWIKDLSAMDPWFILPILMGATMYVQQLLNPQPADPMQAKVLRFLPIIFTLFMLFFPAGLVLYWTVNNLFSMIHQHLINKRVEREYQARTGSA